jgi:hypothetical protein
MGRLFFGIFYSDEKKYEEAARILEEEYGALNIISEEYDFDAFTKYYSSEMGKGLVKRFLVTWKEIEAKNLKDVKRFAQIVEDKFCVNGNRSINIDPGVAGSEGVVLVTCKGEGYKENIGDGYWLHKMLKFEGNKAIKVKMTFPDFKSEKVKNFFEGINEVI